MSEEKKQKSLSDMKMIPELDEDEMDERDSEAMEKIERDKVRKGKNLLGNLG